MIDLSYQKCRTYVENLANCTCDKMNINLCLLGFLPFLPLSESLSGFSHYTLQTDRPISVCQTSLDQKLSCDNITGFAKKSRYAIQPPVRKFVILYYVVIDEEEKFSDLLVNIRNLNPNSLQSF